MELANIKWFIRTSDTPGAKYSRIFVNYYIFSIIQNKFQDYWQSSCYISFTIKFVFLVSTPTSSYRVEHKKKISTFYI